MIWAGILMAAIVGQGPDPGTDRGATRPADPQAIEFFEARVRPILARNCFACHGPKKQKSGLRLDRASSLLKGGDSGPVVVPGDSESSPLIQAIRYDGEIQMPPTGKLAAGAIDDLTAWVRMGAPWPD